nr:phosphotransferase [Planobispora longispora]
MLTELLTGWMRHQRWFAGKGRPVDGLTIDSDVELAPGLRHLIVSVHQAGTRDRYQILLGCCNDDMPDKLRHATIGEGFYDAAHDADLTGTLLEAMADGRDIGPLRFRHLEGTHIDTSPRSLVLGAEQSNTSLVYGDAYICKLFRRLIPGVNPELEIVNALALRKAAHIAQPYGWIETDIDGEPTTLAMTQEFLSNSNDGWALALASVRDLYACLDASASEAGGDFSAESFRLGTATAEVHQELAAAFPTGVMEPQEITHLVEDQRRRLAHAVTEVPELGRHAAAVEEAYQRVCDVAHKVPVQRVHGDYHLGQVMRTPTDWVVLDFEGEPGQPLPERRALASRCATWPGCSAPSTTPPGTCWPTIPRPRNSCRGPSSGPSSTVRPSSPVIRRAADACTARTPFCCAPWSWARPSTRWSTRRATGLPGCPSRWPPSAPARRP